uniref:Polyprotein n=1 Tax=Atrato Nege-like virus 1 TaxID=2689368 RepID=A0A6B9KG86_9VIRU|nr:polyprotein [Atrato Nege-like virus 1]
MKYKSLSKEVILNQRLSDSEKSKLLSLFSPPYKLKFLSNPTDIGSHLFYRALNEIATYRCYDLLPKDELIPSGYQVLIKEVGASVPKLIKYNRTNVHACTPNLNLDDTIRITNTAHALDRYRCLGTKEQKFLARRFMFNPFYRCKNKSQHCYIRAKYLVFAHSSYDCSLTDIGDMMDSSGAVKAVGFIHYSSKILSNLTGGSDNGLNWDLSLMVEGGRKKFYITFWFDDDYQNVYKHSLDTYLGIIRTTMCVSRNHNSYIIQRTEELGGLLFYSVLKPVCNIPKSVIMRQLPFSDPDNVIVHYYNLQNDPSKFMYHELIPIRLVVPRKFFEKLYYYLHTLPDGKFTVQNAMNMASTMASRTIVNGAYVSQPYDLTIQQIDLIAYAAYFIVYCKKYDYMEVLKKLKNFEDIKRNPTFFRRLCSYFHSLKNLVLGINVREYTQEHTLDDVIKNAITTVSNDYALEHSRNVLQWIFWLFRIKNKYDVKFFPITRVVTVEEDIDTVRSVVETLPLLVPDANRDEVEEVIKEHLKINRVSTEKCTLEEYKCECKGRIVHNDYDGQCLLRCVSNALNIPLGELKRVLLKSKFLLALFPTTRVAFESYITGRTAEIELFELIACEYTVNICVHLEGRNVRYTVPSDTVFHFYVAHNHCNEFRPVTEPVPFELSVTAVKKCDGTDILMAKSKSRAEKFKMFPVVVEDFSPYLSRSALILAELDAAYSVIKPGRICELSAAPGSWLQYCNLYYSTSDLYYSHYIDGENLVESGGTLLNDTTDGDLTSQDAHDEISAAIEKYGCMNTLLSDLVFNTDGQVDVPLMDEYQNGFFASIPIWLLDHGNVVFRSHGEVPLSIPVLTMLRCFKSVKFVKPCFSSSIDADYYIVAEDYLPDFDSCCDYTYGPIHAYNRAVTYSKRLLKGIFPRQTQYVVPTPFNIVTISTDDVPVEVEIPVEDEECDESYGGNTFESEFYSYIKIRTFYDVPESASFEVNTDIADVNPDLEIHIFDVALLNNNGDVVKFLFHNSTSIRVDLSTVDFIEFCANLSYMANKIATSRLKIFVDLTAMQNVAIVNETIAVLKKYFLKHVVKVLSNHIDCAYSVSEYKLAIAEFCSYTKSLSNTNLNTYKFYFGDIVRNSYVVSTPLRLNLERDSQNISVLRGREFIFKHPKCKPDDYSHVFDGVSFIKYEDVRIGEIYLQGDFTYRMFDQLLMQAVSGVDVDALENVQFVLIQGVAGHGKTREIVMNHRPRFKKSTVGDLVLTPTLAGKQVLIDRTMSHYSVNRNNIDLSYYRTVTSYLVGNHNKADTIYVDEVMMMHVSLVLACAYYSGAKTVYLYGDTQQIPAHSMLGDFDMIYNTPLSLFKVKEVRSKSYRIPMDVAAVLSPMYYEAHSKFGFNEQLITTSTQLRSLMLVKINDVSEMMDYYNDNTKYLTFTHSTESELLKLDGRFSPTTIASYQGSEHSCISVVRTSYSAADKIYNDIHICVTALTRHTKSFVYYTTCDLDVLSSMIKSSATMTDMCIRKHGSSSLVGSVLPMVVPQYVDQEATLKFFVSKSKFTHRFTLINHNSLVSEKEVAMVAKSVTNDVFVDKSIFKKFSMSDLLKWFKKCAPNVKRVFVKVHNEPFIGNEKILDVVEDYKCANVIGSLVTEKLVAVCEPFLPDNVCIENFIDVNPSIEMLQSFMCHLYPGSVFINTDFDAYMVHHSDLAFTLSGVSFASSCDKPVLNYYQNLRPILSTPVPAVRDVTQREILLGIQKRNLNPPELVANVCPDDVADHLLSNFESKLLVPYYRQMITEMEPVVPTTHSIVSWLERQDRAVLSQLVNDIPIMLVSLSECTLSLKRNPKIRITPDAINIYDSVQTITYHPKFVNAYFCSIIDAIQDRLMAIMLPYFKFFTKVTTEQFGVDCQRVYSSYGKLFLFSGDDSLLISRGKFKEMDMSKFDKSQLLFALLFLVKLMERLGVPKFTAQLYYEMMYYRICKDPSNKVTMLLTPQMESGSAATYFGNTCFCAAVVLSSLDLDDFSYTPRFEKFSLMFNLETKEFDYVNPYFCSKFLVISEWDFKFYPDPIKILIKLGRKDLKNFGHLKEFHTSLKDLISQYRSLVDIDMISAAVRERYKFPYDCGFLIRNIISVIKDDKVFSSLFYTLPTDMLNVSAVKFSDF